MTGRVKLIVALVMLPSGAASAQASLKGFWVLSAKTCEPTSRRCAAPETGLWRSQLAIDVRGDNVIISEPPPPSAPLLPAHTDTLRIDGKVQTWLESHRGIARREGMKQIADQPSTARTSVLWPGESWLVSTDGRTLVHEYRWTIEGNGKHQMTWTYHRSAG